MRFRRKKNKPLTIDITPLIDVVFLLLIFFMISTTFLSTHELNVKLPGATTKSHSTLLKPLEVSISSSGEFFIAGQRVPRQALKNELIKAKQKTQQNALIIHADGNVRHKQVVFVMDRAKLAGIDKLSIATVFSAEKP